MSRRASSRWWWIALLLGALILATAFFFDANVHAWVVAHQTPRWRSVMLGVSRFGDWPAHFVVGLIGASAAYFSGSRNWLRIFIAMIAALAIAGAAAQVLKISTGRARPSVSAQTEWNGFSLRSKYQAFPSGHTAASTAFFGVLCFARRPLGFFFLPIPLLIAASRVLLDAHHLSDVVFAAILGALCAGFVWRFVAARETSPA